MYVVVEISERDFVEITRHKTLEDAVTKANRLLDEHLAIIDRRFDPERCCAANKSNCNAWCNLAGVNWDAYIAELPA